MGGVTVSALSQWSQAVRARDGNACTRCGSRYQLHAHHKKPKSSHPELALVLSNGLTLCQPCHFAEHATNKTLKLRHKPHRATLDRRIAAMQARIDELEARNAELLALVNKPQKAIPAVKLAAWQRASDAWPVFDPAAMAMAAEGFASLFPAQETDQK